MKTPSIWAIVVLIVVVLVLFGASRLPDIAASVGKSMKIFKREVKELYEEDEVPTTHRHDSRQRPADIASDPSHAAGRLREA